jgi:hypothetical protein
MRSPSVIGLIVATVLLAVPAGLPGSPPQPRQGGHALRSVAGHPITPFSTPR